MRPGCALPDKQTKVNMHAMLNDIRDGAFAGKLIAENKDGCCFSNSKHGTFAKHPVGVVDQPLQCMALDREFEGLREYGQLQEHHR